MICRDPNHRADALHTVGCFECRKFQGEIIRVGGSEHLPVLDRSDDAFFSPLKNLDPRGARVYLGMIHNMAGFKSRLQTARKYLPDFGLGGYCGFGRVPVSELPNVLADHFEAMKIADTIN